MAGVRLWSHPTWVARTPLLTVVLLEAANVGQLWRMWSVRSSLGQNPWSWLSVQAALWLWLNFYRVMVPKGQRRTAMLSTALGIVLNAAVCASVWYFQARGL